MGSMSALKFSVGVFVLCLPVMLPAQAWNQNQPRDGACFYTDANYRGGSFCMKAGENTGMVPSGFNDRISSIQIFGRAEVAANKDQNFSGEEQIFRQSVPDLKQLGNRWNDAITAIRVNYPGGRSQDDAGDRGGLIPGVRNQGGPGSWWGGPIWGRPQRPSYGACFYESSDFNGRAFCLHPGQQMDDVPRGFNDRISSIQLFGGAQVTVYRDSDFRGTPRQFRDSVRDLRGSGWNDRISSIRLEYSDWGQGGGNWWNPQTPRAGVCFYENSDFRGRYFCVRAGEDLPQVPGGFNDRISSMQIFGDVEVEVYRDSDFRSEKREFRHSVRDLRNAGGGERWNDAISSVRIEQSGGGGGDGGEDIRDGACFFTEAGFRGRSFCLQGGDEVPSMPIGFNDRVSSIRIIGRGRVTVFKDDDYRGERQGFDRNVEDLGRYSGWNDSISSARVN